MFQDLLNCQKQLLYFHKIGSKKMKTLELTQSKLETEINKIELFQDNSIPKCANCQNACKNCKIKFFLEKIKSAKLNT